jgi:hypothetical protein
MKSSKWKEAVQTYWKYSPASDVYKLMNMNTTTAVFTRIHASAPRKDFSPPPFCAKLINCTALFALIQSEFGGVFTCQGFIVRAVKLYTLL